MRILLDDSRCASVGICETIAPDLFEVGDDGALLVLDLEPPEARRPDVEMAVAACPTGALSIED